MKVTKTKDEFKSLSMTELQEKLNAMRREYFSLKLNATTAHVKDYSQFNKLKKNIARALTYMHQASANT